jgi:hypothetical protein
MDSVNIRLPAHNDVVIPLSREAIMEFMPESILAQALSLDPNTPEIVIPNPIILPEDIQMLANYFQGIEPLQGSPHFREVDSYLNIPWLAIYSDPLYNKLHRPMQPFYFEIDFDNSPILAEHNPPIILAGNLSETNWDVFEEAFGQENSLMLAYLLRSGFDINGALIQAFASQRLDIADYLLSLPGINPSYMGNMALIIASWLHQEGRVKQLLEFPEVTATAQRYEPIIAAFNSGDGPTLDALLATLNSMPSDIWDDLNNLALKQRMWAAGWVDFSMKIGKIKPRLGIYRALPTRIMQI